MEAAGAKTEAMASSKSLDTEAGQEHKAGMEYTGAATAHAIGTGKHACISNG